MVSALDNTDIRHSRSVLELFRNGITTETPNSLEPFMPYDIANSKQSSENPVQPQQTSGGRSLVYAVSIHESEVNGESESLVDSSEPEMP